MMLEQMFLNKFGPTVFENWLVKLKDVKIPDVAPNGYEKRDLRTITSFSIHHAAGNPTVGPAAIDKQHKSTVGPNAPYPSPGIAYHVYIYMVSGKWKVAYVGAVDTIRWHTASNNFYTFGICCGGNYEENPPPWELIKLVQQVIEVVRVFLERKPGELDVKKHKDFPHTSTSCPGNAFSGDYWAAVDDIPAIPEPALDRSKIRYAIEEGMRAIEKDGFTAESKWIESNYLADAKRRENE